MHARLCGAAFAAIFAPLASAQWFHLLDTPIGVSGNIAVEGISGDGTVAFGKTLSDCDPSPLRWVRSGGILNSETLGFANGLPRAASIDGSHIAGDTNCDTNPAALTWSWTPQSGLTPLSTLPITQFAFEFITSMSNDGTIVAGYGLPDFSAEPEVAVKIGSNPITRISITPTDGPLVSGDGSTVVCLVRPSANPNTRVLYRWTAPNGPLTPTITLPVSADLLSVSADGSAVYFQNGFDGPLQRYRLSDGLVTLSGNCCSGLAVDATPDGSSVVGLAIRGTSAAAWVWDAVHGRRWLDQVLTGAGVDLQGAVLSASVAISDDGTTIVGSGTPRAWIADLDFVPPAPCDPDLNQDGNVDQDDIAYLINVVGGGDNPTNIDPDFNHDGNVDQDDIASLVDVVGGGNCP